MSVDAETAKIYKDGIFKKLPRILPQAEIIQTQSQTTYDSDYTPEFDFKPYS